MSQNKFCVKYVQTVLKSNINVAIVTFEVVATFVAFSRPTSSQNKLCNFQTLKTVNELMQK